MPMPPHDDDYLNTGAAVNQLADQTATLCDRGVNSIIDGLLDLYSVQITMGSIMKDGPLDEFINRAEAKEMTEQFINGFNYLLDTIAETVPEFSWFWMEHTPRDLVTDHIRNKANRAFLQLEGTLNADNN